MSIAILSLILYRIVNFCLIFCDKAPRKYLDVVLLTLIQDDGFVAAKVEVNVVLIFCKDYS